MYYSSLEDESHILKNIKKLRRNIIFDLGIRYSPELTNYDSTNFF